MRKFDEEINNILARNIEKRKKKISKELQKTKFRKSGPQGMPIPITSPALKSGLPDQEVASSSMPTGVMP